MSLKKKNFIFIGGVVLLFGLIYWIGISAEGPPGRTGLGNQPDLSKDDETIVFPYYKDGAASLFTSAAVGGEAEVLAEPEEGASFIKPAFSPDGHQVAFIKEWEEEGRLQSQLMIHERSTGEHRSLLSTEHLVTEAVFAPNGEELYFIKSSLSKEELESDEERSRGLDVYKMNVDTEEVERVTTTSSFSMNSLQVTEEGDQLLYYVYNGSDQIKSYDLKSKTTESIRPEPSYRSGASEGPMLSEPRMSPDGEVVAFSDVASHSEQGTFQYEVFHMTREGEDVEQVTNVHAFAGGTLFFRKSKQLLITIDRNFAGRDQDLEYWIFDRDGSSSKEVIINIPEQREGGQ
ncbi:TolB family protein [Halobacillus sp. B23F22_1]|uniref:TolB family protein n=1 Tax=Halobacillus sp. B23F22_1 TaxID=3459514 RepID=UPI00373F7EB3